MEKLPRLSGKELIKILSKNGFKPIRQRGSHVFLVKETTERKLTKTLERVTNLENYKSYIT